MAKNNSSLSKYPPCELKIGKCKVAPGFLYLETKNHYVFINNTRNDIDLGVLKNVKTKHLDPECKVSVFPKSLVDQLTKLEMKS